MGIRELMQRISENRSANKAKFKEMQEQDRLETMLEERKKSSNQRELEKIYRQRQEDIYKKSLDKLRKKENTDMWKDKSILKGGTSILKNDRPILRNDRPILKQGNIFKNKSKAKGCFIR